MSFGTARHAGVDQLAVGRLRIGGSADAAPRGDEACEVSLIHVTARETGPLVRIDYEELPAAVGQLTITAQESTLARGAASRSYCLPVRSSPSRCWQPWSGRDKAPW